MSDPVNTYCPGCGCEKRLATPIRIEYECGSHYFLENDRFHDSERCLLRRILNKLDDIEGQVRIS